MKKALITGITGQDGSYLAEFLLEKGYEVHGITRRASISNTARIDHLIAKNAITLHDGDLSDSSSLVRIISIVQPDEIYNLAAQSHVQVSFDVPEYSGDVDAIGVLDVCEHARRRVLGARNVAEAHVQRQRVGRLERRRTRRHAERGESQTRVDEVLVLALVDVVVERHLGLGSTEAHGLAVDGVRVSEAEVADVAGQKRSRVGRSDALDVTAHAQVRPRIEHLGPKPARILGQKDDLVDCDLGQTRDSIGVLQVPVHDGSVIRDICV